MVTKPNQLFIMTKCCILANLVKICQPVYEISCTQALFGHTSTFWLIFSSLSPAVTLKIRSRSQKPNKLFIMSQCYIHPNLVKLCQLAHDDDITHTRNCHASASGIRTKNNMFPSPSVGGQNNITYNCFIKKAFFFFIYVIYEMKQHQFIK